MPKNFWTWREITGWMIMVVMLIAALAWMTVDHQRRVRASFSHINFNAVRAPPIEHHPLEADPGPDR